MNINYYAGVVVPDHDKPMIDFGMYSLENTYARAVSVYKYGT